MSEGKLYFNCEDAFNIDRVNQSGKSDRNLANDHVLNFTLDLDCMDARHRPEFMAQALEFPSSPCHLNKISIESNLLQDAQETSNSIGENIDYRGFTEPFRRIRGNAAPKRFFRTFWIALSRKLLDKAKRLAYDVRSRN